MLEIVEQQWMQTPPDEFEAPTSRNPPPPSGTKTHFPNAHYGHPLFDALNTSKPPPPRPPNTHTQTTLCATV